jgi:hypothetical protein
MQRGYFKRRAYLPWHQAQNGVYASAGNREIHEIRDIPPRQEFCVKPGTAYAGNGSREAKVDNDVSPLLTGVLPKSSLPGTRGKRQSTAALQNLAKFVKASEQRRSVLECGCALPLSNNLRSPKVSMPRSFEVSATRPDVGVTIGRVLPFTLGRQAGIL